MRAEHLNPGARRFGALLFSAALVLLFASAASAQSGANAADASSANSDRRAVYEERFDRAWRLVDERYWRIDRTGVDWQQVGNEYRPRALAAESDEAFYALLEQMYEELGDDHSVYVPPARVAEIAEQYGALPCVALFSSLPAGGELLARVGGNTAPPLTFALLGRAQSIPDLAGGGRLANVSYGLTAEGVGYLRVPDLASAGVAGAVRRAVNELVDAGAWSFVLDLRQNPGGRLVSMMEVAGVFTTGFLWRAVTSWSFPLPYPALGLPATDLPLAVLVDGNVHSAAEGLAGALQARGRAVVIGEASAGNVEALLPFCLRDGSQAWLATGVLAPVLGRTWEGQGVLPDVNAAPAAAPEAAVRWLLEHRRGE